MEAPWSEQPACSTLRNPKYLPAAAHGILVPFVRTFIRAHLSMACDSAGGKELLAGDPKRQAEIDDDQRHELARTHERANAEGFALVGLLAINRY